MAIVPISKSITNSHNLVSIWEGIVTSSFYDKIDLVKKFRVNGDNDTITIYVKSELSAGEYTELDTIISDSLNVLISENDVDIISIGAGKIKTHRIIGRSGEREKIGANSSDRKNGEDLWRGNELSPKAIGIIPIPNNMGEQMSIVSESSKDKLTGTGLQKVRVHYIKASDGLEKTEIISLNGTTPVDFTDSDIKFINDITTTQKGSSGVAAGNIKIFKKSDSTLVYDMIYVGRNSSELTTFMVPNGCGLLLKSWHAEEAGKKRCSFKIQSTDSHGMLNQGVFNPKDGVYLNNTISPVLELMNLIPEQSIVKITLWSDQSGAEGSGGWRGILIDK